MKNGLLVSVIIPVFNVCPYLNEALDSVIAQTYKNLEIIIVDDGSTDGSGEICDEYAKIESRIHVIHQNNQGLSYARNIGLEKMTGDVVAFLDSDDAYEPQYIQAMVTSMIINKADLVVCRYTIHKTTGKLSQNDTERKYPSISQGVNNRVSILQGIVDKTINVSVWNKLYCKRLWQNIRFPNGHVAEDRATTFKIIDNCERIYILDESLYLHRIRPGSITQTASIQKIRDKVLAFDQLQEFVEKNTPKVFDNRQLKKSRKEHINCLMSSYADSLIQAHNSSDIYSNELRKRIVTPQNKEEIKECSIKMRAAFLMICFCPHLLKLLYSSYYPINRLLNRITGR